jgi:arylsulfate sulfotransferase
MKILDRTLPFFIGLLTLLPVPAFATVAVATLTPSQPSPEPIGKTIKFTATATDTGSGPVAFQFLVTPPKGAVAMVKDFVPGTLSGGAWTSPSWVWVPTGTDGVYKIQVVAKDFGAGQSASKTISYTVKAVVTGSTPVAEKTANPLVALFSTPSCAKGSEIRAVYEVQTASALPIQGGNTNWVACQPPSGVTFEVAGMYPSTAYYLYAETKTGSKITPGTKIDFTTGALPKTGITFPTFTGNPSGTDTANPILLHNFITFAAGGTSTIYPDVATDLSSNIVWYYYANDATHSDVLTRPLQGGGMLTLQDNRAWDPTVTQEQYLRQIDLAGNVVRETNMGAIQQELIALGAVDGGSCTGITNPTVGTACVGSFHHDAIQTLPNGYMAALLDTERIYPIGTQGDKSGLPVDIIGDMIIVMNANWQVVWYWDVFNPSGGGQGYPQLPVTQTAPLGETCGASTSGCPPMFLLKSGSIAPLAHDWLHANTLYYWPAPQNGNPTGGDIVWSSRHQDRIYRINYKDGAGDGSIVWQMGPPDDGLLQPSNFTLPNTWNDPWPWFSHQHDVGIQNGGAGQMTLMDNGNTRTSTIPTLGLGKNCGPDDCDSRGMALTITTQPTSNSATNGLLTPLVSYDLGGYSSAMGSADLLSSGNYFFENAIVFVSLQVGTQGFTIDVSPTGPPAPQVGAADVVMDVSGPQQYRAWQMPSLYSPPTT